MKKKIKKIISVVLALMLVTNPTLARVALASEGEGETSPEVQEIVVEPVLETSSEEESQDNDATGTIETGDAESEAEVDTTVNTNETTVEGEITTPEGTCSLPEAETECEDTVIVQDNEAEVVDDADSSAGTGTNEMIGAEGDAEIDTGDATASATIENQVNSNVVIFDEESCDECEDSEEPPVKQTSEEVLVESPEGEAEVVIVNDNQAAVSNDGDVQADTGENTANENAGDATIATGDALAYANLINFINTNLVGSDFVIDVESFTEGLSEDVDLNKAWEELLNSQEDVELALTGDGDVDLLILNENQATLDNELDIDASTGSNAANENGGDAAINTGDASALANVVNFVNINILGSKFFLGVFNIFGLFEGDLVLPRPDFFVSTSESSESEESLDQNEGQTSATFVNSNEAEVVGNVSTYADTGENETSDNEGDNSIETGNAQSQSNLFSFVNTNISANNWFFLIVNSLGSKVGKIFGWTTPSSSQEDSEPLSLYQLGMGTGDANVIGADQASGNSSLFVNNNTAGITNDISVTAMTGQNQASGNGGSAGITTGDARSLANVVDFANLNIWGSRWFLGVVNILGDWTGNTYFAYPDVSVSIQAGSDEVVAGNDFDYAIFYENEGKDTAEDVVIEFELPKGVNYVGDTSEVPVEINGNTLLWNIGSLEIGQIGVINVNVNVESGFEEEISFWDRIIPVAHAAEEDKIGEIVAVAYVGTSDTESDLTNNSSSATTAVYSFESGDELGDGQGDQRQPILEITAKNNVNGFVYPGDTVTFEITISNKSDVPSYNTKFVQKLYNEIPGDFGTVEFELGTIEPGRTGRLSFGLALKNNGFLEEGHYYTLAYASGNAANGNEVTSNTARTDFNIKYKSAFSLLDVKAAGKEEEAILGESNYCPENEFDENILPYVFLLLLSSMYISKWSRLRLGSDEKTS